MFLTKPMNLTHVRTSVPTFLVLPTNIYQFLVVCIILILLYWMWIWLKGTC
jgi:hypothetical protein